MQLSRNKLRVILALAASAAMLTACIKESPKQEAKRVLDVKTESSDIAPAETGYEYAEKVGIEDEKMEEAFEKVSDIIDIESINSFTNTASANREVNTIDLRVAEVTGKDGKKYTVCFDGIRGTLFGVIDEDGNNLADQSEISRDFADIVLGEPYVAPEDVEHSTEESGE